MSTQTYTGTLTVMDCPNCGMTFGVTAEFEQRRRGDGGSFHCPLGHSMSFKANREAALKRDLQYERDRAEREARRAASAEGRAQRAENSRRVTKGHLTRVKRRVAHGVCPCCNRTFKDLAAHMTTKHPDFAEPGR